MIACSIRKLLTQVCVSFQREQTIVESGEQVVLPSVPAVSITGWVSVTEVNYQNVAPSMPSVTSGMLDYLLIFF